MSLQSSNRITGSIKGIKDWINSSIYNKDELSDLFIQNNSNLQAYNLLLINTKPKQYIRMIGQNSNKVYNIYLEKDITENYLYKGLFFFNNGEKVKIYDVENNEELLTFKLTDYIQTVEIDEDYKTSSIYYMDSTSDYISFGGRTYPKAYNVPSYGTAYRLEGWTCVMLLSLEPEGVLTSGTYGNSSYYAGPINYKDKDWYVSGPNAALSGSPSNPTPYFSSYDFSRNTDNNNISTEAITAFLDLIYEDYIISSPYYYSGVGTFSSMNGRNYNKNNFGGAYCLIAYDGVSSNPVLLSKDQNCITTNNPTRQHSFTFLNETWYVGGWNYGFDLNASSASRYIDISAGSYTSSSADNYRIPIVQESTYILNQIYGTNEDPII